MVAVRVGQARELIGKAVTDAVRGGFEAWFDDMDYAAHPAPTPAFKAGRERTGHDASRVPEVPLARVESTVTGDDPKVFFTYKVEYGGQPLVQLSVRPTWARQVAGAGWAVMDGRPVVDVLEWDDSVTPARPARVRTALISADYDASMHGWRAHADNRACRVAWTREGTATIVMPWDEPSTA
ncbi:hypothetical protein GCM10010425_48970 [Streptomyces spororaveus]|uniref:Uncharacterized protein n=1 Tax=Streptomyces spororaveus TaxID=284039 RepID=A0ABQ3T273_9ACTN|nr:hypothetical protein [Streptomyces spororaveus]GHI74491.1 hypothetical protein Sspor_00520 [Streptomyces spororaveus]